MQRDRNAATPALQHRHFAFIAKTIREMPDRVNRIPVAREFAKALAETNPRFDRERFLAACREE
jgi:hypothetical protein